MPEDLNRDAQLPSVVQKAMPINYTPRGDRVIVRRLPPPVQVEGEVIIPGSQQKPLNEGIVIAVGPELADIQIGAHVCFLDFAGTPVEVDGEEYLSMREQEIHGIRGKARSKSIALDHFAALAWMVFLLVMIGCAAVYGFTH